jgi:hypothetical protein
LISVDSPTENFRAGFFYAPIQPGDAFRLAKKKEPPASISPPVPIFLYEKMPTEERLSGLSAPRNAYKADRLPLNMGVAGPIYHPTIPIHPESLKSNAKGLPAQILPKSPI